MDPVILTFIAPAHQCNQACPACAIALLDEPVKQFDLRPEDYVKFAWDFYEAGIPIRGISFQGYEVTLPQSWPYAEAVFKKFGELGIPQSFVTNGMLLHRYAKRIKDLNLSRIVVSIDGSDEITNDKLRGLPGALKATTRSVGRFLEIVPQYAEIIAIASVIYGDENADSLVGMPKLIRDLGLERWMISSELITSSKGHLKPKEIRKDIVERCREAAEKEGVRLFFSDEFGYMDKNDNRIHIKQLQQKDALFRLLPTGHVCRGERILGTTPEKTLNNPRL